MIKDKECKERLIKILNDKNYRYKANTEEYFYLKYHNNAIKRVKRDSFFTWCLGLHSSDSEIYNILRDEPYFMGKIYNVKKEYSKRQKFLFELLDGIRKNLKDGFNFTEKYCCFLDAHNQNIANHNTDKELEKYAFEDNSNELENIKKNAKFMSNRTGIPYNDFFHPIISGEYEVYRFFSHYDVEKIINEPHFTE